MGHHPLTSLTARNDINKLKILELVMTQFVKIAALALTLVTGAAAVAQAAPWYQDMSTQNAIRTGAILTPHGVWDSK